MRWQSYQKGNVAHGGRRPSLLGLRTRQKTRTRRPEPAARLPLGRPVAVGCGRPGPFSCTHPARALPMRSGAEVWSRCSPCHSWLRGSETGVEQSLPGAKRASGLPSNPELPRICALNKP